MVEILVYKKKSRNGDRSAGQWCVKQTGTKTKSILTQLQSEPLPELNNAVLIETQSLQESVRSIQQTLETMASIQEKQQQQTEAAGKELLDNKTGTTLPIKQKLSELQRTQRNKEKGKQKRNWSWLRLFASCTTEDCATICHTRMAHPIITITGDTPHLAFATATSQGNRSYQEDRFVIGELKSLLQNVPSKTRNTPSTSTESAGSVIPVQYVQKEMPPHTQPPNDEIYVFAVLDGHGFPGEGYHVAAHCGQRLLVGLTDALLAETRHEDDVLKASPTDDPTALPQVQRTFTAQSRRAGEIMEPILPKYSEHVHSRLLRSLKSEQSVSNAVAATTMALDRRMWLTMEDLAVNNGCTLSGAVIHPGGIQLLNVGDSRAMVGVRSGPGDAVGTVLGATRDHKAKDPAEQQRVLAAGGTIQRGRVNGDLNVSRTLGDLFYKTKRQPTSTWPISNVPDVVTIHQDTLEQACGKEGHAFMLVATDGFWDVVNNQKAAALVSRHLTDAGLSDSDSNDRWEQVLSDVAVALVTFALVDRKSNDNTTVQVIVFKKLSHDIVAGETAATTIPATTDATVKPADASAGVDPATIEDAAATAEATGSSTDVPTTAPLDTDVVNDIDVAVVTDDVAADVVGDDAAAIIDVATTADVVTTVDVATAAVTTVGVVPQIGAASEVQSDEIHTSTNGNDVAVATEEKEVDAFEGQVSVATAEPILLNNNAALASDDAQRVVQVT